MHNTLKRAVIATNQKAQYDAKVKNLRDITGEHVQNNRSVRDMLGQRARC